MALMHPSKEGQSKPRCSDVRHRRHVRTLQVEIVSQRLRWCAAACLREVYSAMSTARRIVIAASAVENGDGAMRVLDDMVSLLYM